MVTLEVKLESGCDEEDEDVAKEVALKEVLDSSQLWKHTGKGVGAGPDLKRNMTRDWGKEKTLCIMLYKEKKHVQTTLSNRYSKKKTTL